MATTTTRTELPLHATALEPVVRALEDGDVPALVAALDAADADLLNHPGPSELAVRLNRLTYSRFTSGFDFFDTHKFQLSQWEGEVGIYPTTLLSCATVMLTTMVATGNMPRDTHPFRQHNTALLLKLYKVLVNHPKIDVNAVLSDEAYEALIERPLTEVQHFKDLMREGKHHDRMTAIEYALSKDGAYINHASANILAGNPDVVRLPHNGLGDNSVVFILMMSGKLDYTRNVIAWGLWDDGMIRLDRGTLEDQPAIRLLRPRVARVRLFMLWFGLMYGGLKKKRLKYAMLAPDGAWGRQWIGAREDTAAWDQGARMGAGLE